MGNTQNLETELVHQAEDLLRNGAPGLHFYTLNRAEPTRRIWDNLGLSERSGLQPLSPTATN